MKKLLFWLQWWRRAKEKQCKCCCLTCAYYSECRYDEVHQIMNSYVDE